MRLIDYQRGLRPIGPLRVTKQLYNIINARAREEDRTITNYLINLIINDAIDHGHEVEDHPALNGRRRSEQTYGYMECVKDV